MSYTGSAGPLLFFHPYKNQPTPPHPLYPTSPNHRPSPPKTEIPNLLTHNRIVKEKKRFDSYRRLDRIRSCTRICFTINHLLSTAEHLSHF